MTQPFSRRDFLYTAPAACTAAGVFGLGAFGTKAAGAATSATREASNSAVPDGFPSQDPQAVKDVVAYIETLSE